MDQIERYYVYSLVCPLRRVPFYFGKGTGTRAYHHTKGWDKANPDKIRIIELIRLCGHEPIVHILKDNLTESTAFRIEDFMIKIGKTRSWPLVNKYGTGGRSPSQKTRNKISSSLKGKVRGPMPEETKIKLSLGQKGRKLEGRFEIQEEVLCDLYFNQNKTLEEISSIYNISVQPIKRLLKECELNGLKKNQFTFGATHSQSHLDFLSLPKPKVTCPSCGKIGGKPIMHRYHFENCKHSPSKPKMSKYTRNQGI